MTQWSFAPLVAIAIFLGFMFFGYFFGLAEGNAKGYKKRQKEEAEEKKQKPAEPPPVSSPLPADEAPLLDVSMTTGGELHLKLDGQSADTSALGVEQRKRLIAILTQMRPWLEAPKPTSQPSTAQPRTTPPPSTPQPAPSTIPSPTPQPTAAPHPPAPTPGDDDEKPTGPQSIVAQIDSILQARLAGTPLAGQGIRLQESLEGSVIVWVGVDKYEGVEDVPDEQIKTVLHAAIAEWENKFTPGI